MADSKRLLHTMIRVGDLGRSLDFYVGKLGMRELRRQNFPEGRFTLSFIGYGDEADSTVIELTHNWDEDTYSHGSGFGHLAVAVRDIKAVAADLKRQGVTVVRDPGPMRHAADEGIPDVIAFIEDPDGYRIELIEVS